MGKLIYRELYLTRKILHHQLLSLAIIFILEVLVRLSMISGNLSHMNDGDLQAIDEVTHYLFTYLIPLVFFLVIDSGSVIVSDAKSKWVYSHIRLRLANISLWV